MFEFFGCVAAALAVAAPVISNLGDIAQGGQRLVDFAGRILGLFGNKVPPPQQPAVARAALAQAAAMPAAEFAKKAEEIVEQAIPDKPAEYKKAVTEYLKLMPARIRATFARRDDPTGTTAPAKWAANRPEDLVPLLPPRPPLFKEGDNPPEARRWKLIERLGIGGFGEVWKAQNVTTNTFAAFKFCLDAASKEFLKNEKEIIAQVIEQLARNAHVVKLQDAFLDCDTPWLQYEYVAGGDLGGLVATWPKDLAARSSNAVTVLKTLAGTVAQCHGLNPAVVHRDLKPGNVLVDRHGSLMITDFGISDMVARQALDEAKVATLSSMTGSNPTRGVRWASTPLYASPQQQDGQDSDPADDVHALGVLLYQMLVGDLNARLGMDFRDHLGERHVCKELIDVLSFSVAATVERRYKNAAELAAALGRLPADLIRKPVPVSPGQIEAELDQRLDARYADADAKNAEAERLCERREWAAALAALGTIRHPRMRRPDLVERAEAFQQGKRFINALGMEFARVPKGTFWMGGGDGTRGDKQIAIETDFYLGVYPVTQEEWQKVMGTTPSHFRKGGGGADKLTGVPDADLKRFPVESVSWNDCQSFLQKLNEKSKESGWMYRLPREAEWEYACRGGAS
ncbi:MAG: bifunctional serine/threonine-protein kinase/formylglycine-generating enzyme family protein, partial [Gemmataceae bacterium]